MLPCMYSICKSSILQVSQTCCGYRVDPLYYSTKLLRCRNLPVTSIVNSTRVLRVLGLAGSTACGRVDRPARTQEICGVSEWEGVYVDYDAIEQLFACMPTAVTVGLISGPPSLIENPTLRDPFRKIDTARYIVLTTRFLNPYIILIRRSNCYVNVHQLRGERHAWDSSSTGHESFVSPETAIAICAERKVGETQQTIERLMNDTRIFDWKRVEPHYVQTGCDDESAKSIETSDSLRRREKVFKAEQVLGFSFNKRKRSVLPTTQDFAGQKQKGFAPDELGQQPKKKPIEPHVKTEHIKEWLSGFRN